jgi:hypothetical protein
MKVYDEVYGDIRRYDTVCLGLIYIVLNRHPQVLLTVLFAINSANHKFHPVAELGFPLIYRFPAMMVFERMPVKN